MGVEGYSSYKPARRHHAAAPELGVQAIAPKTTLPSREGRAKTASTRPSTNESGMPTEQEKSEVRFSFRTKPCFEQNQADKQAIDRSNKLSN